MSLFKIIPCRIHILNLNDRKSNNRAEKMKISSKDGSKVLTVIASPGQGPDRSTEVSYTDTKVSD